jgi:hypothetical protein
MTYTVNLDSYQISDIVAESLKEAYNENLIDEYSPEILGALEVVLQYYMKPSEYNEWFENRVRNEQ